MTAIRRFVVPYPPQVNNVKAVARGRLITSEVGRAYFESVARLLAVYGYAQPMLGPVALRLDVFRPRRSGDLSNRLKVLEDAIVGAVIEDDSQVVDIEMHRWEDPANPRVQVTVGQVLEMERLEPLRFEFATPSMAAAFQHARARIEAVQAKVAAKRAAKDQRRTVAAALGRSASGSSATMRVSPATYRPRR